MAAHVVPIPIKQRFSCNVQFAIGEMDEMFKKGKRDTVCMGLQSAFCIFSFIDFPLIHENWMQRNDDAVDGKGHAL